ncbi:hypothetical protein PGB90_009717 [Kerria lacca]
MKKITVIKNISKIICYLKYQVQKNLKILVIQIYASTADAEDVDREKFYDDLEKLIIEEREYFMVVMGDWNAKVGEDRRDSRVVGEFGLRKRNKAGDRLVEFAVKNKLKIANTFFFKNPNQKVTWTSPDGRTKNEIDHLLTNDLGPIDDISTLSNFDYPSDHKISRSS